MPSYYRDESGRLYTQKDLQEKDPLLFEELKSQPSWGNWAAMGGAGLGTYLLANSLLNSGKDNGLAGQLLPLLLAGGAAYGANKLYNRYAGVNPEDVASAMGMEYAPNGKSWLADVAMPAGSGALNVQFGRMMLRPEWQKLRGLLRRGAANNTLMPPQIGTSALVPSHGVPRRSAMVSNPLSGRYTETPIYRSSFAAKPSAIRGAAGSAAGATNPSAIRRAGRLVSRGANRISRGLKFLGKIPGLRPLYGAWMLLDGMQELYTAGHNAVK